MCPAPARRLDNAAACAGPAAFAECNDGSMAAMLHIVMQMPAAAHIASKVKARVRVRAKRPESACESIHHSLNVRAGAGLGLDSQQLRIWHYRRARGGIKVKGWVWVRVPATVQIASKASTGSRVNAHRITTSKTVSETGLDASISLTSPPEASTTSG